MKSLFFVTLIILLTFKFKYISGNIVDKKCSGLIDKKNYLPYIISDLSLDMNDFIISPEAFFSISKNILFCYPYEVITKAINNYCLTALNIIKTRISPDLNQLKYLLINSVNEYYSIPLTLPELLWQQTRFNKHLETAIFITGWFANYESAIETISEAYLCRGNTNFVIIDAAQFLDTLYTWSAYNTEDIGRLVALSLKQLTKSYPIEKVHLIGHSLGAHVAGSIGRNYKLLTGKSVRRITGLDPSKSCFNDGSSLPGLSKGDADFVDVIHSNPGVLGKSEPVGDVDFYPNGFNPLQPGCLSIVCAHGRAIEYYAETVFPGNEYGFMAIKCIIHTDNCNSYRYPMGYAVPLHLTGNYFLPTNSTSPFGKSGNKVRSQVKCSE